MRTIGIVGGMSWESSAEYYALANRLVRDRLGAPHSARLLLWSFDFAEIAALQHDGRWDMLAERLADAARRLEAAGAGLLLIATNTMHLVHAEVAGAVTVPVLHIADPVGAAVAAAGMTRIGLLGTAFTMERPFFADRLAGHGIATIVPDAEARALVHRVIYDELVAGIVAPGSRAAVAAVAAGLVARGAQGIVLGCTELMLLLRAQDVAVPLFDKTRLHVEAAVAAALA